MSDSLLEIRNLTKRYGENTVLRDLSFTVRRGEVIVVLGPSGCGKSTLLRCINALELIQGGEILLGGEVIDRSPAGLPALRRRIGMVFQSYELFPHMTVMENILLAPCKVLGTKKEDAKAEARQLLEEGGLARTVTVTCLGDPRLTTGRTVRVVQPSTGLTGAFWIDSDRHTWEGGVCTTRLGLNLRNVMYESEAGGELT